LVEWAFFAALLREAHVGQHIRLGLIHQRGRFGNLGPELVGDATQLGLGLRGVAWANAVAMNADTTRLPRLPPCARAFRMKWTRERCQEAMKILETAALSPGSTNDKADS
jgi:hypothetical protein